jgi:tetratricopeptide (TPR) repeat protein
MWVQIVRQMVARLPARRLAAFVGSKTPADTLQKQAESFVDLADLLALGSGSSRLQQWERIIRLIELTSRTAPALIALDNVQRSDPASLQFLSYLVRTSGLRRVLVVCMFRDTEIELSESLGAALSELARAEGFTHLPLGGLSHQEVGELMGSDAPDTLVRAVFERTEGNPLYVEAVASLLGENLVEGEQALHEVPARLKLAIMERIRVLPPVCRRSLARAAVIGREFSAEMLLRVLGWESDDRLDRGIDAAIAAGILEEVAEREGRLRFTHALIRDVIYEEIPHAERGWLHEMVADDLAKRFGSAAKKWAARIAGHYQRATSERGRERCARFSAIAGTTALETFAFEDAAQHLERAIEARSGLPMNDELADLTGLLGQAQLEIPWIRGSWDLWAEAKRNIVSSANHYLDTGNVDRLADLIDRTEWVWRDPEMHSVLLRALSILPRGAVVSALALHGFADRVQLRTVWRHYRRELRRARREHDSEGQLRSLGRLALTDLHSNRLAQAWRTVQRIEKDPVYGGTGWLRAVPALGQGASSAALTLAGRVGVQYPGESGQIDRAIEESQLLEEHMARLGWSAGSYHALALKSSLYRIAGRFDEAREAAEKGLAEYPMRGRIALCLALVECETGQSERAAEIAGGYLQRIGEAGVEESHPDVIAELAALYAHTALPQLAQSAHELAEGRQHGLAGPNREDVARTGLALLAVAEENSPAASRYLEELGYAPPMMRSMVISTDRLRGLLALALGRFTRAARSFRRALRFAGGTYPPETAWACYDLARALIGRGRAADSRKASDWLGEGRTIASALGMNRLLAAIDELETARRPDRKEPEKTDGM